MAGSQVVVGGPRVRSRATPWTTSALWIGGVAVAVTGTWYGILDGRELPTLKISGALLLAVGGGGLVLLARLHRREGQVAVDDPTRRSVAADLTRTGLALLSMDSALIHLAVISQHWEEYWLYGAFFVAVALVQLAWAIALVMRPSRPLLWIGGAVNALVAVAWVVTRTYGSLVGPAATETEKVGFGDLVSTAMEALIVVGCVWMLASQFPERADRTAAGDACGGFLALATGAVLTLALYSAVGGPPFVSHVG